jgi:hypothetical protein
MLCYSQNNDTIFSIDSTKVIKLKEITVSSKVNKAGSYQLLIPRQVIKNETLDKTIRRVSFVTIDNDRNLYFRGKKINSILLNDKLISIEEFNKLNVEDIKNIYIVSSYFNQSTGNVEYAIKISEKKKYGDNIKGSLDFSQVFLQKFNSSSLSLNNKLNKLSSRLYLSGITNKTENNYLQNVNDELNTINNYRELFQPFISLQNVYDIDEKSAFYVKNKYSIVDDNAKSIFSNSNDINYRYKIVNYGLNVRYDKKISDSYVMKLGFDYINFNNSINSLELTTNNFSFSRQKFNEYTFSPSLQKKGNRYELTNSLVLTHRNYNFNNTLEDNKISQNLVTHYISYLLTINDNNSISIGNRYQFEDNRIDKNRTRHHILPNFTYYTKFDSITEFEINYKRNIQRPSINSISRSTYIDNNGNEIINREFLLAQTDNFIGVDMVRQFKKFSVNLSSSYTIAKNYLTSIYDFNGDVLTNTSANINHFSQMLYGASFNIPIYQDASLNCNYVLSSVKLEQDAHTYEGNINRFDISFSGSIYKKYLINLNTFYIDKFYDYNTFYRANPDFSISLTTNYFKEKINVNLEFRNVLNQDGRRTMNYNDDFNSYYQLSKNQSRLLLLTLSYNFGKNFKMSKRAIQNTNNDIKPK